MDNAPFQHEVDRLLQTTGDRPLAPRRGRGIVTTAGGRLYFVNAYVNVRLLPHLGCQLPVEWFHLGSHEMTPEMIRLAESVPGVRCVDLSGQIRATPNPTKSGGGWQSKPLAVLRSSFEEVLFLDADSLPLRDPTFLFEAPCYREHGALFWPDIHKWDEERFSVLTELFDVPYAPGPEFESGQFMVHVPRCWRALVLTEFYNRHSDLVYQHVYGDKDTFYFGLRRTGTPFHVVATPVSVGRGCLLQHDPEGQVMFCHCVHAKWTLGSGPAIGEDVFPHRNACYGFIKDLRRAWSPAQVPRRGCRRQLRRPRVPGAAG